MIREDLRNIAIIAHVDHGKTTLVDKMLRQGGAFRDNQSVAECVMDSNELERERGITILAKNTSIHYNGIKINIVDTPGHADFSGEVERILKMVDGVLLLVDAFEGPMPQTRFVLQKALEYGHRVIVVINKIDRPDARLYELLDEILELLMDLDATSEQLDSPVVYCSARQGVSSLSPYEPGSDLLPLLDTIVDYIPAPNGDENGPAQVLVSAIDYNDYVGRIAIGKVERGVIRQNQEIVICDYHTPDSSYKSKVSNIYQVEGLQRAAVNEARVGDIVCISGIGDVNIGNTICDALCADPLPFVKVSEPTIEMTFSVNDSPFAGQDGKYVTSRHLRERLYRELLKDVSLHVEETGSSEAFRVLGRGEMHLSILIETMRREGYELQVSMPRVLYKEIDGKTCEPMEHVFIDVPQESMGGVMEKFGSRKGELLEMSSVGSRMRLKYKVPSRGLFGFRGEFLTATKGEGIMNAVFLGYEPVKGGMPGRSIGSLIAHESGEAVSYGLYNAQERGTLFIGAGTQVYTGMIVGETQRAEDISVNVCKKKHVTNMRASGSDDALRLVTPKVMSLEESLEYLDDDELLEVTPKSLRLRKRILDHTQRVRSQNSQKQ